MRTRAPQFDQSPDASLKAEVAVPRPVARAIQYMRGHLNVSLSIRAIAAASGAPERTLRRQFRHFTRKSPIAYHRDLRLSAVQQALCEDHTEIDVTSAAAAFGFSHFGRFTEQYRIRFGELPSETLRARHRVLLQIPFRIPDPVAVAVFPFSAVDGRFDVMAQADSMTAGVISALGRLPWVRVQVVKHGATETRIGAGTTSVARYAIRGQVKSIGSRVQVTVNLFEEATARHIWGDAVDDVRERTSALQEKAVGRIARALPVCLRSGGMPEEKCAEQDPVAVELFRQAFGATFELTRPSNDRALETLDRVRAINREFPRAIALTACCKAQQAICFFGAAFDAQRNEVRHLTSLALSMDNQDPMVLAVLGWAACALGDLDLAETLIEKCLAIDPFCVLAWQRRGWIAAYRGNATALVHFRRALALSPNGREQFNTMLGISHSHFKSGSYDRATEWAVRAIRERPSETWACRMSVVAQERSGQKNEARRGIMRLRRQYPDISVTSIINVLPEHGEVLARTAESLESAGLPV